MKRERQWALSSRMSAGLTCDYPEPSAEFAKVNIACSQAPDGSVAIRHEPLPQMPDDLRKIIE